MRRNERHCPGPSCLSSRVSHLVGYASVISTSWWFTKESLQEDTSLNMSYIPLSITQGLAFCIGSWILWRTLKARFTSSPLDNIRGPPPQSYIAGSRFLIAQLETHILTFGPPLGNYAQLYDRQGWDFHKRVWAQYGTVAKIHAAFSVRTDRLALGLL